MGGSLEYPPPELNPIQVDCLKNVKKNRLDVLLQQAASTLASGLLIPGQCLSCKERARCRAPAPFGFPAQALTPSPCY